MARVLAIGGVFFKARDPQALRAWYAEHLQMPADDYGASLQPGNFPAGGYTQWSPFAADTNYFAPSSQPFMINFIVDDLDAALDQVRRGGAQVMPNQEHGEYGQFGWFIDPDGNKVELWVPPAPA